MTGKMSQVRVTSPRFELSSSAPELSGLERMGCEQQKRFSLPDSAVHDNTSLPKPFTVRSARETRHELTIFFLEPTRKFNNVESESCRFVFFCVSLLLTGAARSAVSAVFWRNQGQDGDHRSGTAVQCTSPSFLCPQCVFVFVVQIRILFIPMPSHVCSFVWVYKPKINRFDVPMEGNHLDLR